MPDEIFCENCGAPNRPQAQFCESCGRSLHAGGAPAAPSYPNNYIPQTEKMDYPPDYGASNTPPPFAPAPQGIPAWQGAPAQQPAKRSTSKWIIIGAGLAILACCAVAAVVAIALNYLGGDEDSPLSILSTETSTAVPTSPPYKSPEPGLTGQQRLSETDFFDDFSSDALKWYVGNDAQSGSGYENEAYFIEVKVPDYRQLVQPPVHELTHLSFMVNVTQGAENGSFGVSCYYSDLNNYHFVAFDVNAQQLLFGRFENSQVVEMSDWQKFDGSQQPLQVAVDCTPGLMSAYVNDALISELQASQPVGAAPMWLFGMTWTDASGGMKIIFDDVEGYQAMQ